MKEVWFLSILAQHILVNMYSFLVGCAVMVSCLTGSNHTTVVLNNQSIMPVVMMMYSTLSMFFLSSNCERYTVMVVVWIRAKVSAC